jgi:NADP-dependent 3-hydroxy acid dehydrogenase YdfG
MPADAAAANTADPIVWVTGAGSGMGRAISVAAARDGYRVVLSGRRKEALETTATLVAQVGGESLVIPMDATKDGDVRAAHREMSSQWGPVLKVVQSAGLNHPKRYWRNQSISDFTNIVQTNLVASARIVDLMLPDMRVASDGLVVFVSSYSGWRFSPDAGVAYSASKTALSTLAESLNAQENPHGIRACHLCPGDVDTQFLQMRPNVPHEADRAKMLSADDIARATMFVLNSPSHVCVNELVISPTKRQTDAENASPPRR